MKHIATNQLNGLKWYRTEEGIKIKRNKGDRFADSVNTLQYPTAVHIMEREIDRYLSITGILNAIELNIR